MEKPEAKTMLDPGLYPMLAAIGSPADLRRLEVDRLPDLCREIRHFLVHVLAVNPGHFASSMGAVEITVALHYVFDTPHDRIVWDVGHQAYVHKLLTGRAADFDSLRKLGGISGFPNPAESTYDTFTAGHASNSISAALGMALASELKEGDDRNVVAVIGDAAISGGLAFEGLNNAANQRNNLLIVLNDNDMSIDRNVGSLNSYLAHLTASKRYNRLRFKIYNMLKSMDVISEHRRGSILRFNNSLKALLSHQQNIFEGLNIRYFGPFDGHDVVRLVQVFRDIKDMSGPRLLHLRTVKGKGYEPAEKDPSVWHAPGRFDADTGERVKSPDAASCPLKYQDVFGRTLVRLAEADKRVVAITAAMPSGTSVSMMQAAMPDRTFDVGISEGHAVTFAGGLAKEGMRPVVAIYSSFLQRAYDHIIHDVAIQHLPVLFCIDRAGVVGEDGPTHHGMFDLAYLRTVPGLTVAAPRSEVKLSQLMHTYLQQDGPFAIRYPRGNGRMHPAELEKALETEGAQILPIGRSEQLAEGTDVAVLSIGTMAQTALDAAAAVSADGVSVAVHDMIYLKPLDTDLIESLGRAGTPIVTVEDGTLLGGLGSAVAEALADRGYTNRVARVGAPDRFIPHGTPAQLYEANGMDAAAVVKAIKSVLR